jgi:hypothetical protein
LFLAVTGNSITRCGASVERRAATVDIRVLSSLIVPLSIMVRHERASNESPEPAISKPSSRPRKSTEEVCTNRTQHIHLHLLSPTLQKARHSSKRKIVDQEESDSEQNGQPSAKPPRPPAKTAKKVCEIRRSMWTARRTSHCSQEFPHGVMMMIRTPKTLE